MILFENGLGLGLGEWKTQAMPRSASYFFFFFNDVAEVLAQLRLDCEFFASFTVPQNGWAYLLIGA